jgi:hypothetical protein
MTDDGSQSWDQGGLGDEEPYPLTERQIAFKRLAAHALVDAEFYQRLRDDPAAAAEELYISLPDEDVRYLREIVDWPVLDERAEAIRAALHLDEVVRSIW